MGAGASSRNDPDRERLIAELGALRDENARLKRSESLLRTVGDAIGDAVYAKDEQGRYVPANPAAARVPNRTVAEVLGRDDTALCPPEFARQIEESRQRFQAIFENALDGFLLFDDAGCVVGANTATCQLLGYSRDEILRFTGRDLISFRDCGQAPELMDRPPTTGTLSGEGTMLCKGGATRDVEYRSVANILPGLHLAVLRDITDRKRAEETLRQSESLLADSQQLAHVGSWSLDIATGALMWSDEQYRIFGLRPGAVAMTFDRFLSFVHPNSRALVKEKADHALRSGERYEACYRVVHEDATERVVQSCGQVVCDDAGKPVRMFGSVQDITERKLVEETLQANEQLFRAVFEGALDAMVLANDDGRYVAANPAACRLFARPLEELLDHDATSFVEPGFDAPGAWAEFRRSGSAEGLYRLVRPDGTVLETEYTAKADVLPGRHLAVLRDVSERRRAEESLRKSERRVVAILESITDAFFAVDRDWRIIYVNPQAGPLLGKTPAELLGADVWEEFPEAIGSLLEHRCRRAATEGDAIAFEEYYPPPLGRWFNVHAYPSADGLSVYFTDVTERKGAEEALRRYAERLAMLHETDQAILAARSSVQIAQTALERLGRIIPLWRGSVAMIDLRTSEALIFAAIGAGRDRFPLRTRLALDRFDPREIDALREDRVFVADDIRTMKAPPGTVVDLLDLGVRSYARVPLTTEGQLLGSLNLYSDRVNAFERDHVDMAREVADSLAIAIRQAQLFEEVKTSRESLQDLSRRLFRAEEAERRRIAGELHDEIGQSLTALKLNLRAMSRNLEAPTTTDRLEDSIALVERTIEQVRGLSLDLRPALLDDLGLVPALRSYVGGMARRSDIAASFVADDQFERQDPEIETACYRIAQEAMTNVARHSGAKRARVELARTGQALRLIVADDGPGFDVEAATERAAAGASLGLLGMRERASLLGGHVEIASTPGRGTEVRATFPLPPEADRPTRT